MPRKTRTDLERKDFYGEIISRTLAERQHTLKLEGGEDEDEVVNEEEDLPEEQAEEIDE